ncbi:MAG: hypothetical protein WAT74_11715 [Flavobacteriales bacterium]
MAILALGVYQLELTLDEVWEHGLDYKLVLMCKGINVFSALVEERDGWPAGTLYIPACASFDECFRPLLTEEWPVRWTDEEDQWITVVGYPGSFLYALEMREPFGHNESFWTDLGKAAKDRDYDRFNRTGTEPKRFNLERDSSANYVRLSFQFHDSILQLRNRPMPYAPSMGFLAFDAYVSYADLERFLDLLEQERSQLTNAKAE